MPHSQRPSNSASHSPSHSASKSQFQGHGQSQGDDKAFDISCSKSGKAESKAQKRLAKLCHKAARKSLGLKKADLKTAVNLAIVSELGDALMQSSKVQALPCPAKGEKKARQKLLTKLARRSLIESSTLLSTKPSANDGDLPRADAPQKALSIAKLRPAQGSMAFALTPLKRRPCGGCEALKGGLCQCALKLAKRRAG